MAAKVDEGLILESPVCEEDRYDPDVSMENIYPTEEGVNQLVERLELSPNKLREFDLNMSSAKISPKSKRYKAIQYSFLYNLGGECDYFIINNLLIYLTATELITLSRTCKLFNELTQHTSLWYRLYHIDFSLSNLESGDYHRQPGKPVVNLLHELVILPNEDYKQHNKQKQLSNLLDDTHGIEEEYHLRDLLFSLSHDLQLPHNTNNNINHSNSDRLVMLEEGHVVVDSDSEDDWKKQKNKNNNSNYYKTLYISRYQDYTTRQNNYPTDIQKLNHEIKRITYAETLETILDITQARLMLPLLSSCCFLSLLLYCQTLDGHVNIPIWACALPLGCSVVYLLLSVLLLYQAEQYQYQETSMWKGLWSNIRGPLAMLYQELITSINTSKQVLYGFVIMCILLLLQIGLVVVKLSSEVPQPVTNTLSWGLVFVPIWIFFFGYLILPCFRIPIDGAMYFTGFLVIWIPFVILFICLTVKLDHHQTSSLRIADIMIPFFIIEGFVLLSTLLALGIGINRYRYGFIERIDEYLALFIIGWAVNVPLLIFQALLSARDDHQMEEDRDSPRATEVATPILIILGFLTLVFTFGSLRYKTAFQILRADRLHDAAGLKVIQPI